MKQYRKVWRTLCIVQGERTMARFDMKENKNELNEFASVIN